MYKIFGRKSELVKCLVKCVVWERIVKLWKDNLKHTCIDSLIYTNLFQIDFLNCFIFYLLSYLESTTAAAKVIKENRPNDVQNLFLAKFPTFASYEVVVIFASAMYFDSIV